jgi:predicted RNase H-like nuclease
LRKSAAALKGQSQVPVTTCIVGFDSAWTDNPKSPGAICALTVARSGVASFTAPRLATFDQALEFIRTETTSSDVSIVALDQPTIVPNLTSLRPVDRVAGSLVGYTGGGVQPANRSKKNMFGDDAPVWRFLDGLGATQDPERSRTANTGLHLLEVFPALSLPAFDARFNGYRKGPKYNPGNKRTFQISDWHNVLDTVDGYARNTHLGGIEAWARGIKRRTTERPPQKADQDMLDSVLCCLIGYNWRIAPRASSIMLGDLESGYMVAPTEAGTRSRLTAAAAKHGVRVDGRVISAPEA